MEKLINLIALVMLVSTNILTPFSYAQLEAPEVIPENEVENAVEAEKIPEINEETPELVPEATGEIVQENQEDEIPENVLPDTQEHTGTPATDESEKDFSENQDKGGNINENQIIYEISSPEEGTDNLENNSEIQENTKNNDNERIGKEEQGLENEQENIYENLELEEIQEPKIMGVISGTSTTLLPGQEFNAKLKKLAGQTSATYDTQNTTITQIIYTGAISEGAITTGLSTTNSQYPVYAWFTEGIIYYTSEAEIIYMNPNSNYMFRNMRGITGLDLSNFNTSGVTDMSYMFYDSNNLINLNLSGWNTSNVTTMDYMFHGCSNLEEINLDGRDFRNENGCPVQFFGNTPLKKLSARGWKLPSNFNDMMSWFGRGASSSLEEIDATDWDLENTTSISYMFSNSNLKTIKGLNTRKNTNNVTNMQGMFYDCGSLTGLDLSGWDTSNVTNMSSMFSSSNLEEINLNGRNFRNVGSLPMRSASNVKKFDMENTKFSGNMSSAFQGLTALEYVNLSGADVSMVTDMSYMFSSCNNLKELNPQGWNTSNVTTMYQMFNNCSSLKELDLSDLDTENVTNMTYMFYGCSGLIELDLSNWDTNNVTNMTYMFYGCSGLIELDLSNWDTNNVTSMEGLVGKCNKLEELNLSGWNFRKYNMERTSMMMGITDGGIPSLTRLNMTNTKYTGDITYAFGGLTKLEELKLDGADTNSVINMSSMFNGCSSLTQLDLSSFDTSNVTNMGSMFYNCTGLETIYASSGFKTDQITGYNSSSMFYNNIKLVGGNGTKFDPNSIDKTYALIDKVGQTGYFTNKGGDILIKFMVMKKEYTNQTVQFGGKAIRPSNDPIKTGAEFLGWTTKDGEMYDFNTNIKEYTEIYAKFSGWNETILLPGKEFNEIIKKLSGQSNATFSTVNTGITKILQWEGDIPEGVTTGVISIEGSEKPVYAWYDNGVIYYYTDANVVYLNENSNSMFYYLTKLTEIDLSNWDTSEVIDMSYIFSNCNSLTGLDLSTWDTISVTNMSSMFSNTQNLKTIYASDKFVTTGVTSSYSMFYGASNLIGWNGTKYNSSKTDKAYAKIDKPGQKGYFTEKGLGIVVKFMMGRMEYDRQVVQSGGKAVRPSNDPIKTGSQFVGWTTKDGEEYDFNTNIKEYTEIYAKFSGGNETILLPGKEFNETIKKLSGQSGATYSTTNTSINQILQWEGSIPEGVTTMVISIEGSENPVYARYDDGTIYYHTKATKIYLNEDSSYMFYYCYGLTELDLSSRDASNVTDMYYMFGYTYLTKLNLEGWDTSNVTNMEYMFYYSYYLTGLNMSGWDFRQVDHSLYSIRYYYPFYYGGTLDLTNAKFAGDMSYAFYYLGNGYGNMEKIILDGVDVSEVTNMYELFYGLYYIKELDLSSWDTSNVTDMSYMFEYCNNLETIYVSTGFVTDQVTSSSDMFAGDTKLVGGNGTVYNSGHTDKEYAKIDKPGQKGYFTYLITLSFDSDGGTPVDSQKFKSGLTGTKPSDPTKIGNTFLWWHTGDDQEFDFSQPIFEPTQLYAKWQVKQYKITFDTDGGDGMNPIDVNYGDNISVPNPTRNGYRFIGWEPSLPPTMPAEDLSVKAQWEKINGGSSGGGGGGGGGGGSSSSNTGNTASQTGSQINSNTGSTTSGTNEKEPENTTGTNAEIQTGNQVDPQEQVPENDVSSGANAKDPVTSMDYDKSTSEGQSYSTEFQQAYEFAKGNGITTMPTIEKANMEGKLTRIAMAKMLSQYAMNVLGQKPANTIVPKFNDVTDKQNSDYDNGVTLAYQLGIMGQNMPGNKFRPNDEVTRAEFSTALSRMAYGTSDGEYKGTGKYYIHHMEKLVKEGIITKDDPNMKELRGYVMIMLMRSSK